MHGLWVTLISRSDGSGGWAHLPKATGRQLPIVSTATPVAARLTTAADIASVGALHDRLFPNLHYTGGQIIEGNDDTHIRLATEVDGEPVGYVVVEHQPDNTEARALYRSLGFEEEVVLVPLRKGFTVS